MIAVFGGAFNPPTVAHYEVIKHLLKQDFIEKVYVMPVGDHYEKPGLMQAKHRYWMLKTMVADIPEAIVFDLEIIANKALKTVETLTILQILNKEKEFAFVMGADNLRDLPKWSQHKSLIEKFKMIIYNRGNEDVMALIKMHFPNQIDRFIVVNDFDELDISATMYRENPGEQNDLLVPAVADYIKNHNLYS